ncbi:hypothetical protein C6501_09270 [Candidatus Poribacteria bacterium]|nr:MAG: hypothetical protein C6501_09270 [Candidatus Poribacteria bacterium]
MTRKHIISLFLSVLISLLSLSNLCLAAKQVPGSPAPQNLTFRVDPVKKNNSYKWWREWRPLRGARPNLVATLSGDDAEIAKIKDTQYTFTLNVSSYDGYCMNVKDSTDPSADMVFREEDNPDTPGLDYRVSSDGTTLTVICESPAFIIPITVYVYDYGAHGVLEATVAINKKDKQTKSDDAGKTARLAIPLDDNKNDIADGWKDDKKKNWLMNNFNAKFFKIVYTLRYGFPNNRTHR